MTAPFGLLSFPRTVAPWVPTDLGANLAGWWRADLGITIGTGVSAWADQSGNGRHLVQATGTDQPTTGTAIDSQATIYFDDSAYAQCLKRTTALTLTGAHVFFVMKLVSEAADQSLVGKWGASNAPSYTPYSDSIVYDDFGSTVRRTSSISPTVSMATPCLYEVITASSEHTLLVSGEQIFTTGTNTVSWNSGGFMVGCSNASAVNLTPATFSKGYLAEIVLVDRKMTAPERTGLVTYINTRYPTVATT